MPSFVVFVRTTADIRAMQRQRDAMHVKSFSICSRGYMISFALSLLVLGSYLLSMRSTAVLPRFLISSLLLCYTLIVQLWPPRSPVVVASLVVLAMVVGSQGEVVVVNLVVIQTEVIVTHAGVAVILVVCPEVAGAMVT